MSLIGDALRKARSEGAQRGVHQQWLPLAPVAADPPRRAALGLGLLLGAVIALAAGAVGAWLAVRLASPPGPRGERQALPVSATPPGSPAPPPTAVPPAGDLRPRVVAGRTAFPRATPSPEGEEPPPAVPSAPPTQPPSSAPSPPPEPAQRVFVLHADVGYATLDLDFIVYKPSAPFGRINGQDIVPGSIVAGFRVDEIAADYVRLSDRYGPLVLRVR